MTRTALLRKSRNDEPRSWLFVPADSERKIAKALDSDADAIIFDLEDSVAPAMKAIARDCSRTCRSARAGRNGGSGSIRSAAEFHKDDLELIGIADVHGIVLPKAESGADVTSSRIAPATSRSTRSSPRPRRACSACCPTATPIAAGGDELGRRGPVRSAWRFVQI